MKLKKLLLPGFAALLALGLVACSDAETDTASDKEEDKQEEAQEKDKVVTYTEPSEINEKFAAGETFAFVIGNAQCGACQQYKAEALKQLSEDEKILLPFIETLGLEEDAEEYNEFVTLVEANLQGQFEATPTTYFVKEGKLVETIVGVMPYGALIDNLEKHVGLDNQKAEAAKEEAQEKAETTEDVAEEVTEVIESGSDSATVEVK